MPRAQALQQEKHCSEKPAHSNKDPAQPKIKEIVFLKECMVRHPETSTDVNVTANPRLKGKGRKQCYRNLVNPGAGVQSREPGEEYLVVQTGKNAGDAGSVPRWGRAPGEGKGNPLQYSCLENSLDREPGGLQSMGS